LIDGLESTSQELLAELQLNMKQTAEIRNTTSDILSQSSDTLDLAKVTKENLEE